MEDANPSLFFLSLRSGIFLWHLIQRRDLWPGLQKELWQAFLKTCWTYWRTIQLICHYGTASYPPNMQNILETSLQLCKSQPATTHQLSFSSCSSSSKVRSTTSGPSRVSSSSLICSTCSLVIPVSSESSFSARARP